MRTALVRFDRIQGIMLFPKMPTEKFVLVLSGLPPGNPPTIHHPFIRDLHRRGWAALYIHYPGFRESSGLFSAKNSLEAAKKAIRFLRGGRAVELFSEELLTWKAREIVLVGTSFGGAVSLTACAETNVKRVLAVCPVVNFDLRLGEHDHSIRKVLHRVFRNTHRLSKTWNTWRYVNPALRIHKLRRKEVFLVHARNDMIVPIEHSEWLQSRIRCSLTVLPMGGHISISKVPMSVRDKVFGR